MGTKLESTSESITKRVFVRPIIIPQSLIRIQEWMLIACSILLVLCVLYTCSKRLRFAFQYDWIEDGVLGSVRHLRAGHPIYERPGFDYAPFLYTPLFLYISATVSRFVGVSYLPLRIVSIFSTIGCFGVLYGFVYHEVRKHFAAVAAVGCFAACYVAVNEWFDIGRVDMLFIFLLLCALWATRHGNAVFAACLWVCAFQTKQGVLPVALLLLCHDWHQPRRVIAGVGSFFALMVASIVWFNHASQGWYWFYVFGLGGGLKIDVHRATHYITSDLLGVYGCALFVVLASVLVAPPRWMGRAARFYALATTLLFFSTWFIRAHDGSNVNALLPVYAWISVAFGVGLGRTHEALMHESGPLVKPLLALLLFASLGQIGTHLFGPRVYIPDARLKSDREAFEAQLRTIPGDILLPNFPEDGLKAGKPLHASGEATGLVIDVFGSEGERLFMEYETQIRDHALGAVVLDRPAEDFFRWQHSIIQKDFTSLYPLRVAAAGQDMHLGAQPVWIYLPCASLQAALRLDPKLDTTVCVVPHT